MYYEDGNFLIRKCFVDKIVFVGLTQRCGSSTLFIIFVAPLHTDFVTCGTLLPTTTIQIPEIRM